MIIKIPDFITKEECDTIIKIITDNDMVGMGLGKFGNILGDSDIIREILYKKYQLIFGRRTYCISWVNMFPPKHPGVPPHKHRGSQDGYQSTKIPHEYPCTNLFLGGDTSIGTYYNGVKHENKVGELAIFSSDMNHEVKENTSDTIRFSMVSDFAPIKGNHDWIKMNV